MEYGILAIVALVGLCFGSCITLLSYRLPRGMKVGAVRSRCPNCKTPLGVKDLFPVFSWLGAGGACRHCGKKIHWRYPLIELLTMLLFLLVYLEKGLTPEALTIVLLGVCIITLCVIDFEHRIIPDALQWAMLILAIAHHFTVPVEWADKVTAFAGALIFALALKYGFLFLRGKDGLGMGDVKFFAVVGLWLGVIPLVPFLFLSGLLGIVTALGWRMVSDDPRFPFGPALALSLFALVLFPQVNSFFWQGIENIVTAR